MEELKRLSKAECEKLKNCHKEHEAIVAESRSHVTEETNCPD